MAKLKSFDEFAKKVKKVMQENTLAYHREFTIEMADWIIMGTPIETGRLKANWTASVNVPHPKPRQRYYNVHQDEVNRIANELAPLKLGDDAYLSNGATGEYDELGNNVRYGIRSGEGYVIKKERQYKMVGRNISFAKYHSEHVLRRLKK